MTSCRLVAEAIATARKLRDAPNNGDSARHGVDVAAHVLDVTRSGAASAGAAKARHARAGAPLVVRVVLLALLAITFFLSISDSHAQVVQACSVNPGQTVCSDSPVNWFQSGTVPSAYYVRIIPVGMAISNPNSSWVAKGTTGTYQTVVCTGSWTQTSCSAAAWQTHSINDFWETPVPTVVCSPSFKTVSPCPTGYAPKEVSVQTSQQPDAYQTTFDAMPLQEMLYALCIGIAGLLGFSVGVRLV